MWPKVNEMGCLEIPASEYNSAVEWRDGLGHRCLVLRVDYADGRSVYQIIPPVYNEFDD